MRVRLHLCLLFLSVLSLPLFGESDQDSLADAILHQDAIFWDAYNRCDVEKMSQFFWPDIEFYHDKGGPTLGLEALTETLRKNLCGNPNFRLRREAILGTVQVFPLQKNGQIYGAVLSGEHYFYINNNGKPEYRDGMAKFFHVWLLKDGTWKMARVVSYNHHDAPYENKRKETVVPADVLRQYVGHYVSSKSGSFEVITQNNSLLLTIDAKQFALHPESNSIFFTTDRDLTFEFVKDGSKVSKIVVRGRGQIADEATPK